MKKGNKYGTHRVISHDTELWKKQRKLHLFVQHTRQGDGERMAEIEPQMVYVLEMDMNTKK